MDVIGADRRARAANWKCVTLKALPCNGSASFIPFLHPLSQASTTYLPDEIEYVVHADPAENEDDHVGLHPETSVDPKQEWVV